MSDWAEYLAREERNKICTTHEDGERTLRLTIAGHFEEYGILEECRTCRYGCKQWDARPVGLTLFVCMRRKDGKTDY